MRTHGPEDFDSHPRYPKLARFFLWAAGYSPRNLVHEAPEHCEAIGKLGGAVLFAAGVAAGNWAIAAYVFTDGNSFTTRLGAVAIASVIAVAMVLMIDRSGLFFCDVMPRRRGAMVLWLAVRGAIIFAVSSITSQVVVPFILRDELGLHALRMQEAAEARRVPQLDRMFGIAQKRDAVAAAAAEVMRVQTEAATLPVSIQNHFAEAWNCWGAYATRKRALINRGIPANDAKAVLSIMARQCAQKQTAAEKEKELRDAALRSKLEDAANQKAAAVGELKAATGAISARVEQARTIETKTINQTSASVLADLLATDLGARVKWMLVTFVLVLLEMLPLLTKLIAGKSTVGLRISADRTIDVIAQEERIAVAKRDAAISREIGNSMQDAILIACKNPETSEFCAQLFAKKVAGFLPLEIVDTFLRELEKKQFDLDKALRRFPRHAPVIVEVWTDMVREACRVLKSEAHGSLDLSSGPHRRSPC
jgi:hypothetical protein